MNQFIHLIETLETHLDQIRTDLGADWPDFAAEVRSLAPAFEAAHNEVKLTIAVGDLYMACRAREPVMAILRQTADTSGAGHDRKLPPAGTDRKDTMLIQGITNRFQSLVARLEETESLEESKERPGEDTTTMEVPIDRRAHP